MMPEDIDFIMPNFKTIEKPPKPIKPSKQLDKKKPIAKSFQITKSFVPETVSQIHEQLRPEVDQLKRFLKLKKERERKQKSLIAEGLITKKEQQQNGHQKKQESAPAEKYKVDESGQLRDEKGNLVFVKNQTTELKINQKKQQEQQLKQLGKKQRIKFHQKLSRGFLDRNLVVSGSKKRIRRSMLGLQFLQQGSYQPYSSKIKSEPAQDLDQVAKNQLEVPSKIVRKRFKTKLQFSRQVPKCEWWDLQIVNQQAYEKLIEKQTEMDEELNFEQLLNIDRLSNEVVFQKVGDEAKRQQKINIPLYLTKDERKKLKRKRKREKLMQKNDMVKLGLIQPEKPKLKVSNMAIVMKDQFIIDPSKVEAEAKRQQQQRLNKHLQANSERKLTRSQKKEKAMRKLKKDSAKQCRRIVFKLNSLRQPSHVFKVNMNAKQLALNGFVLTPTEYHSQPVVVMAEGGQKAIRFFRNLMMNRIKWNEKQENECRLIWEGEIENSRLGKWRTIEVGDESETIRALQQRGVQNFSQYLS